MINKIKNLIIKFLQSTQKFTGSDNIYIAKNGTYLLIGNIISIIASFLLSIAFAQLLPKETYGQYRYILSISAIIAILSLQGINKAIIPSVAKGFENTIKQAFKTKIKWGIIGSLISIIVAGYFWTQNQPELTISLLIIAVFLPLFKAGEIYQSYLDGKKLFGKRVSFTTIIQIISSLLLFGGLLLTKNLIILVLIYFCSYSLLRLFFFLRTIRKFKPNTNNDTQLIRYGKHLSLMETIGTIAGQLDSILLFNFIGAEQLAIYSYAVLTVDYARTPLQIIQEIAVPKLTTRSNEEIKKYLPKKLIQITFLILIGIGIYF
ncbi:MAG TPA: oligosaccharide flippase family protein, partial [Candidatus Portnoybacteria bacterium]|nr:oligosaccharide flippase family protein [Candidatus Portnoybacteria bacterium]